MISSLPMERNKTCNLNTKRTYQHSLALSVMNRKKNRTRQIPYTNMPTLYGPSILNHSQNKINLEYFFFISVLLNNIFFFIYCDLSHFHYNIKYRITSIFEVFHYKYIYQMMDKRKKKRKEYERFAYKLDENFLFCMQN